MRERLYSGLVVILLLLLYGVVRFPSSLRAPLGLIGDLVILTVYGLVIRFWFSSLEQKTPLAFQTGIRSGLVVGMIFLSEMLLEYILLPADNSQMGLIEYGSVLLIFFLVSLWIAFQTGRFRSGVCTAIVSAMIGSIIFLIAVLSIFYLFHGTLPQTQVFHAEGNFADFAQSGLTDFDAFIMQDFWGAGFFHSILLPVLAGILGSVGSLLGILFSGFHKRNTIQ